MKKILSVLCIATLLFASCSDEYDDSKLWQNVNDLKDRIASLEKTVQTMNSDIGSIQSIVDAINARDYIVKIEELADKSGVVCLSDRRFWNTRVQINNTPHLSDMSRYEHTKYK